MTTPSLRVAVVPARGGSKRIPRKNIKDFHGVPLIKRTLRTLLKSGLFDQVVVSTDDDEIAEVAKTTGASAPFKRAANLADDHTPTAPVILDALNRLKAAGMSVGEVAVVYPAAVFTTAENLMESLELLRQSGVDQVFSACKYEAPIERAWRRSPDGTAQLVQTKHAATRSQDLAPAYYDAGQFYWWAAGIDSLVSRGLPLRRAMYLMPRWRVQDIDTPDDWEMAERLFLTSFPESFDR